MTSAGASGTGRQRLLALAWYTPVKENGKRESRQKADQEDVSKESTTRSARI